MRGKMTLIDLTTDQLLTTTRSVRKRLDLTRPVEPELICECIEIATKAPTGAGDQPWHFVVVTDPAKRNKLAKLYNLSFNDYVAPMMGSGPQDPSGKWQKLSRPQQMRLESSMHLAQHLHEVPVLVIPCITGRPEKAPSFFEQSTIWGSILPGAWSFMLAARARGLGSTWTTLHLVYEREAAQILGIPYEDVAQVALLPVAYTLGTNFKPSPRKPLDEVYHLNNW
jgi:nitroreductase